MYKRIHVLPKAGDLSEAATFLVSSLLISHGVRLDTISIIHLEGKWIMAYGDKIRHLRPDQDSSEGWIKAVLYKERSKNLGAYISGSMPDLASLADAIYCVTAKEGIEPNALMKHYSIHSRLAYIYADTTLEEKCANAISLKLAVPRKLQPAIMNILLDRIEARLELF